MAAGGRGGEVDAQREVRERMPVRFLGGELGTTKSDAPVVLIPSIQNVVALASEMERIQSLGRRVILDSDGDLLAGLGLVMSEADSVNVVRASRPVSQQWVAAYKEMVRAADAVTVSTPYLADRYRAAGARKVFVCPNAIDPEQWIESPWREDDTFTVGFAGGPGHDDDLALIKSSLMWASAQESTEAVIFGGFYSGGNELPQAHRPSGWRGFAWRHVPFTPRYEVYRYHLTGLLDVGLVPLTWAAHNRGRSDLKIAELAMAGTLPIVSDVPNYASWKDTPVLFARDAGDFRRKVEWAVSHRDEVRERAIALRGVVLRERAAPAALEPWQMALRAV
jgi:hypothetical protein